MGDYSDFCESYGGCAGENYSNTRIISKAQEINFKSEYKLTDRAWEQVQEYVSIYRNNSLKKHHEVNHYITQNGLWGRFTELRSMNDHGNNKVVPGITEKHYKLICEMLEITGGNGDPLIKADRY